MYLEPNPLCPSLLPEVLRCFAQYFDIDLLGVKYRPPLETAFEILMNKRHQILTVESAPIYFAYLNKLDGLNRAFIQSVTNRSFIPLGNSIYLKPSQVFIRSSPQENRHIFDDRATRGLIDYIDYGPEANSFLFRLGVLSYPSAENLADLLIERQASYFSPTNNDNTDEMIAAKLRIYTNCLKQLAAVPNIAQQFNCEPLRSRLINQPWCLAYQIIDRTDGNKERIFRIARPSEIYLDDDHQSAIDLQPLCAPDEPELTKLYAIFGSKWLSESVQRTLVHQGNFSTTDRSEKLHELIHYRLDMLFVNNRVKLFIEETRSKIVMYSLLGRIFGKYRSKTYRITAKQTFRLRSGRHSMSINFSISNHYAQRKISFPFHPKMIVLLLSYSQPTAVHVHLNTNEMKFVSISTETFPLSIILILPVN